MGLAEEKKKRERGEKRASHPTHKIDWLAPIPVYKYTAPHAD
jgi:hypothetical protein